MQDASNEILISPASYWEIAIKISIGKWQLNRPHEQFIDIALNQYGFRVLPILPAHTAQLIGLPVPPQGSVRPAAGRSGNSGERSDS